MAAVVTTDDINTNIPDAQDLANIEEQKRILIENFTALKALLEDFETRIAALEVHHP